MKLLNFLFFVIAMNLMAVSVTAQTKNKAVKPTSKSKKFFIDVHHLGPGKVTGADVAAAHSKDLAVEGKYHVQFIKYWVDTAKGDVYCLSQAARPDAVKLTHARAHGLLPDEIFEVTDGTEAKIKDAKNLFLDIHQLGAGKVTAAAVADAHKKDLAVQKKYGVNFINYWVDEKKGVVMCLSEASDSSKVIQTHKEAHGLLPTQIIKVKQGQ